MKPETMTTATALLTAGIPDKNERAEILRAIARVPVREKLLTTRQAAALAAVTRKTLFRWARQGHLHPHRITPARVRWPQSELEAFLCQNAEG